MQRSLFSLRLLCGFIAASGWIAASAEEPKAGPTSLYLDYSPRPNPDHLLAHELNVIQPGAECDLAGIHQSGSRVLAYLSLAEIAESADYLEEAISRDIPFLGSNPDWNSRLVDITSPDWGPFLLETLAASAIEKGFDGFFLDTVDSHQRLAEQFPEQAESFREAMIDLIENLRIRFPDKQLLINRGFDLLPDLETETLDGVLVESVFRGFDPASGQFLQTDPTQTALLTDQIQFLRSRKIPVYVVDYVSPEEKKLIRETEEKIRSLDAVPFLTIPRLDGTISAGGKVARRILVLFGHDPSEAESSRIWPADTTAYAILQMPLEHLGYELDYHDVGKGLPAVGSLDDYAGVILDEEIHLPFHQENDFVDWILAQQKEGRKLLFLGSYAFSDSHARDRLFAQLEITGNEETGLPTGPATIAEIDETLLNFEAKVVPSTRDFENLAAPEDARVFLSLTADLAPGPDLPVEHEDLRGRYDAIYHASWGGALLSPYVVFEASEETVLQFVDPFSFLEPIFPGGRFPAPDPTTRDGLRVFYTHIDGDGFSSLTSVDPGKTCAEVLFDRILRDLPWPITVSVVEAEIRGHMLSQPAGASAKLSEIARRIFQLPHVEPASHSYSHPYLWIDDDAEFMGLYDSRNLALKLQAGYSEIDAERETIDSLSYVSRHLAPAEKPAELLLWSGNCRPSPEALRLLRSQGFENMNGGNTIVCDRFPGLFGIAPRTVSWDGELQINAANQNEFMYTNGWMGPTWNGFSQVIETFERTEEPRRLKPVNVYYHFYSAERPDAFAALETIYAWCREQELHAMTALQFARATRDSFQTRLVQTGARRWTALNQGQLRTFRIPTRMGTPDLALSEGVVGFHHHGDEIYLHTDGRRRVSIQLSDQPSRQARLETASAPTRMNLLSPSELEIQVLDRPTTLVLAGFLPDSPVRIIRNEISETHETDAEGRLRIHTPASTRLAIRQGNRR